MSPKTYYVMCFACNNNYMFCNKQNYYGIKINHTSLQWTCVNNMKYIIMSKITWKQTEPDILYVKKKNIDFLVFWKKQIENQSTINKTNKTRFIIAPYI